MQIVHDKKQCIGCQNCSAICPEHFKPSDDGKVDAVDTEDTKPSKSLKEASESCPVSCIKLKK